MSKLFLSLLGISSLLLASSVEVSVIKPELNHDFMTIEADGVVLSKNTSLIARTSGVVHFYVNDNVNVSKGETIAKVDDKRRQMRLNSTKERLSFLNAQSLFEKERMREVDEKYKMGIAAKNELLNEKIILAQFEDAKKTVLLEYEILQLEEKQSLIRANEDGFITQLSNENRFVNYGDQLGTLTPKYSQVKLFVDGKYANNVQKGMRVTLKSDYANTSGAISDILAQTSNNLLEVMVTPDIVLPANILLKAKINIKNLQGLKIPKGAIVLVNNQPAVYEIRDAIARLKFIEILSDRIDFALIKNTLSKDAKIALKNAYLLHDNLEVIVK